MSDPIDPRPLLKAELLAQRMADLHFYTGWEVRAHRARDSYVLVASQFVANKRMRAFVYERVADSELLTESENHHGVQSSSAPDPRSAVRGFSEDQSRAA